VAWAPDLEVAEATADEAALETLLATLLAEEPTELARSAELEDAAEVMEADSELAGVVAAVPDPVEVEVTTGELTLAGDVVGAFKQSELVPLRMVTGAEYEATPALSTILIVMD